MYPAGLTPYDSDIGSKGETPLPMQDTTQSSRDKKAQLKPVSFDDYHTLWRGIATSIHSYRDPNDCEYGILVNQTTVAIIVFSVLNLLEADLCLNQVHCTDGQMTTELQNKSSIETAPLEQRVNQYVINACT